MLRRLILLLPSLLLLAGCSGPDIINAFVPGDGYRVVEDLSYGEGPRRKLDLYIPEAAAEPLPTVVFFYGGGWRTGERADYLFVGEAFASRGYATAIVDYRLYPEVRYPAFLEDGAAAVAWIRRYGAEYGLDPSALYLVGHSAGAYIAAMLALEPRWLEAEAATICNSVTAMVGLAGPYDFLPIEADWVQKVFSTAPSLPPTQPINHVDGRAPPMLLVAGSGDYIVEPENSSRMAARIREAGGTVEEIYYDGIGHTGIIASIADPFRGLSPALEDADRFMRRYPRLGAGGCEARAGS